MTTSRLIKSAAVRLRSGLVVAIMMHLLGSNGSERPTTNSPGLPMAIGVPTAALHKPDGEPLLRSGVFGRVPSSLAVCSFDRRLVDTVLRRFQGAASAQRKAKTAHAVVHAPTALSG